MPAPRPKTNRRRNKEQPLGVAERLKDAPPSTYRHTPGKRPAPDDTYVLSGTEHRFDGRCHDGCENVR